MMFADAVASVPGRRHHGVARGLGSAHRSHRGAVAGRPLRMAPRGARGDIAQAACQHRVDGVGARRWVVIWLWLGADAASQYLTATSSS